MKKYISVFIAAALIFTMFAGIGGTAYAVGGTLKFEPGSVKGYVGKSYDITATVTPDIDVSGYRVILASNSSVVGTQNAPLLANEAGKITFKLTIEQSMVGKDLTYKSQYTTDGSTWTDGATASIKVEPLVVDIGCSVSVTPAKLLDPGDVATFSFKIENKGEAALTDIQVVIPELNNGKAVNTAFSREPASGAHTVTYQHNFTKTITVNPKITYKVNGAGEKQTKQLEPITLTQTVRDVKVLLTADKTTPQPGEEVTFTLTLTNDGNVPYTDLTVTWNGQDMGFSTKKLNAGDERDKQYKLTFDTSQEVRFTVTLKDHKNIIKEVNSNPVSIQMPVDPNSIASNIGFEIAPDREALTAAGIVTFSGSVFNNSGYTIYDVKVIEATLGEVFTVTEMETGTRLSIPNKTFDINETTSYSFTMSAKDRNGQIYTANADPITVTIQGVSEPSPTDVAEEAPEVTLPPANTSSDPLGVWLIIMIVLVVLIIGVGVALFVLWKKGNMSSRPSSPKAVSRPRSPRPKSPAPKTPVRNKFTSGRSRGYRDRNNF